MGLKAGRVGVRKDQVDVYGKIKIPEGGGGTFTDLTRSVIDVPYNDSIVLEKDAMVGFITSDVAFTINDTIRFQPKPNLHPVMLHVKAGTKIQVPGNGNCRCYVYYDE